MEAIAVEHLTKVYKPMWPWHSSSTVLSDVSLSIGTGEIFGFLGHNGAGKTTTMKILLGLLRPTSGRVEVLGAPAGDVAIHSRIGYLPESPYFYDYLTAEEFLEFYGRLAGMPFETIRSRVPHLLGQLGLKEARHRQLRKFSKGMLQRIGLAQALIQDPELVILDEPMSGLDPMGRKEVRDLILGLRDQGKTVVFSSHILSDVEMSEYWSKEKCSRWARLRNWSVRIWPNPSRLCAIVWWVRRSTPSDGWRCESCRAARAASWFFPARIV
jgi:ABC-2 type transport system ATP-binding protein